MPYTDIGKTWQKLFLITGHARRDHDFQFTSLAHLLNVEYLRDCYKSLNRNKAVGIDKVSWEEYGEDLEGNLELLVSRLKRKKYKPIPARRVYIPKGETGRRPLGISALENKIVERGITWILESIYEQDFLNCSCKSRNISFGHFERENAKTKARRPNTFDFLGFTHYCDISRKGNFKVGRRTSRKKYSAKCKAMNAWLKAIRNKVKTKEWWKTLKAKLRGHFQYYGISENYDGIARFYKFTIKVLRKWLNRRSQKRKMSWDRFTKYLEHYPLPKPRIMHSFYESPVR